MTWYGIHIYDYANHDALILHVIRPLARGWRGRPARFFFIRYWHGGPHIRLRADLPGQDVFTDLLDDVVERAAEYFSWQVPPPHFDYASFRAAQARYARREGRPAVSPDLVPHGTVRPEPYHPEYDKYGGPAGVAAADSPGRRWNACSTTAAGTGPGTCRRR